jgi:lipoprotein-anchoring transpeptidase ErfK/SrfK
MELRKKAAALFANPSKKDVVAYKNRKYLKTLRSYAITIGVFIFALSSLSVGSFRVFADTYRTPKVSTVFGADISELTTVELQNALEEIKLRKYTVINQQTYRSFSLEEMGITFDANATALSASLGQDGGVWSNIAGSNVLEPELTIDQKKFKEFEGLMLPGFKDASDAKIKIVEGNLVVAPSTLGVGITVDSLLGQISATTSRGENGFSLIPQSISPVYTTAQARVDFEKAKIFSEGSIEVQAGEVTSSIQNINVMRMDRPLVATSTEFGYDEVALRDAVKQIAAENSDSAWNEIYELRAGQKVVLREGRNGSVYSDAEDVIDSVIKSGLDGSIRKVSLEPEIKTYVSLEKSAANTWIDINLTTHTMTLWENNMVQATFPISGGKEETPTPLGDYKISSKVRKMTMSGPGYSTPNIEYVSWFKFNYAIHSAYWHDEFGKTNVSHGCVNSRVDDAKYVYEWAPIGTKVSVHY